MLKQSLEITTCKGIRLSACQRLPFFLAVFYCLSATANYQCVRRPETAIKIIIFIIAGGVLSLIAYRCVYRPISINRSFISCPMLNEIVLKNESCVNFYIWYIYWSYYSLCSLVAFRCCCCLPKAVCILNVAYCCCCCFCCCLLLFVCFPDC